MEILSEMWAGILWLMDMALHIDVHLRELTGSYGHWIYLILFIIVFCETGLVITPFLPGDSLLFAGGTLVGAGMLGYFPLVGTLLAAAVIGDAVNFHIGKFIGPPVFEKNYRFLKQTYLASAQAFYGKHGGKAIILARFIPIIRTFVPFVAGVASMDPRRFLFFNIVGALIWVFGIVTAGYLLGGLSFVQENFSIIIYLIILISVMPVIIKGLEHYFAKRAG
ncbi:VTT domain-containing protein [Desulfosarcina sp. OttesenSCG-928-A07]|nr:VTT domain-containing protein [Desulfosarcina sp. OttesenSCG-928-G17]MDL2329808.1 VTT domain-containing protein [Desulfosarcina sp. OttesenSCG-928-A07]